MEIRNMLDKYVVFCNNKSEYKNIYEELFEHKEYFFTSCTHNPTIIDCGSHIGLSVIYFKKLYPNSTVLCFEPDKQNFKLLQKNMLANKLNGVIPINSALSDARGTKFFYGFSKIKQNWTWDKSLIKNIWSDKKPTSKIAIQTEKLSTYINNQIDLIKIDIEGSELTVLKEIQHKLKLVKLLYVEFHGTPNLSKTNNYHKIVNLLKKCKFKVKCYLKDGSEFYPDNNFLKAHNPCVFLIRAANVHFI